MTTHMGKRPPTPTSLRVLVVDRHDASRIGLTLMLRHTPGVSTCVAAASDEDAIALASKHSPDVAVVDISERGPFTSSLATALREAAPGIRVALTSRCATSASAAARAARASVFIPAGASGRATVQAVLLAARRAHVTSSRSPLAALSDREREVLALLAGGATNREIAAEMHLGTEAVKKHASTIYRKLGVRNRTEAAHRAREALTPRS
ncbi:MAG: response regulator transcription factor [Solirubrobacterales bacterium]|nr:response regulator transcription factor [Solirubrobacterales bacterium]